MGNVECQNVCPHVAALPPATLGCPPNEARLQHIPHDDCCMDWVCSSEKHEGELLCGFRWLDNITLLVKMVLD